MSSDNQGDKSDRNVGNDRFDPLRCSNCYYL